NQSLQNIVSSLIFGFQLIYLFGGSGQLRGNAVALPKPFAVGAMDVARISAISAGREGCACVAINERDLGVNASAIAGFAWVGYGLLSEYRAHAYGRRDRLL
ncbi:MAG: hypothetical protein ACRER3_16100, partial [Pseudomonas fluorescens]